jgi:tetratricopeptide (TPR) repeat protein
MYAACLGFLLTLAAGCRKAPAPPAPDDTAERQKKAATLYKEARGAPIPEKYERFRRLMALYPDTPPARDSYLELIVAYTHDRPPRLAEAFEIAKSFRERHPTDARVGEGFREVVDTAYGQKDDATRKAALADWGAYLEERDVAEDVAKPALRLDFVRLRLRQERWEDADVAVETALAETGIQGADRVELLVRKGSLLAEKLGRRDEARAALLQALELARKLRSEGSRTGIPPDQIEAELRKLTTPESRPESR